MTRVASLRDVVEKSTGTRNPAVQPDDEFTYVDVSAIDNQQKIINGARSLLGSEAPSRARKLLRANDVLVSTVRPNLNAVALVPKELDGQVGSTGFCVLRAVPSRALPEYLFYFVRSRRFVDALAGLVAGALYPAVTDSQVLDQELPLPGLNEQQRIVDLLSRVEGIVRLRRQAQQKAAALIPAIFVDMFGDPATNPKGWPRMALGDLIANGPTNGLYKHKSAYGSGTPILRIDAFYDGRVTDLAALKRVQVAPDEQRRFALAAGDIIVNRVNSPEYLGKSALVPDLLEPTVFESNMMRFSIDALHALPEFVIALLQDPSSRRHFLTNAKHAINQSSINQQDVKSLTVFVPPLELQRQFAQRVAAVLAIEQQQQAATAKAEATFSALLARAFAVEDPQEQRDPERALA